MSNHKSRLIDEAVDIIEAQLQGCSEKEINWFICFSNVFLHSDTSHKAALAQIGEEFVKTISESSKK